MNYYADRVKETATTTGTGNFTLAGAVSQFRTFTSVFATNQRFFYAIVGQTGTEWEVGEGYLSGATTLVRDRVIASSNSNAAVNFSAGTKDVFSTIPAESADTWEGAGETLTLSAGHALQ